MKKVIQQLSGRSEFVLVMSVVFGYFIVQSFNLCVNPSEDTVPVITNMHLVQTVMLELFLGVIAFGILYVRGWSLFSLRLSINRKDTGFGILLWLADMCVYVVAIVFAGAVFGNGIFAGNNLEIGQIHLAVVVLLAAVNPLFEETFVAAYVIQSLEKKHDPFFVISMSAFIRLLYHTYQGPIANISIIPMGLLHAYVFWRWRKLWPLVVAHAVSNVISFM